MRKKLLIFRLAGSRFSLGLKFFTSNTVSHATLKPMATHMNLSENQLTHLASKALATEILCSYEPDEGDLTLTQMEAIKKIVPIGTLKNPIASLF